MVAERAPDEEAEIESSKAPLLEHLTELRKRLMQVVIFFVVAFVVAYIFSDEIYNFLVQPYADAVQGITGKRLIYTALQDAFFTLLKVSMFAAFWVTFPFLAMQIWKFAAPGLYKN